jgi:hypothetical protein
MATECPLMVAFTQRGKAKILYCGRWGCKHCAKRNAREWSQDVFYGIRNPKTPVKRWHFWTLTMPPKYTKPSQAYSILPRIWDAFRKAIQRNQKRFTFVAFVEGQPERSNMPHFHIITSNTIPKGKSKRKDPLTYIKDFAPRFGFGWRADDQLISGQKAASYVSKYASKGCPEIPKGFRRVRCSRDWVRKPKPPLDPYLVRGRNEQTQDYLMRVADASGVPLDDIAETYVNTTHRLNQERLTSQ